MGIFKTAVIGTVLGGTFAVAGLTWAGGGSIGEGIDLITKQDAQLETFKQNETKLVKQLKATTHAVQSLQLQIAEKNAKIAELIEQGGDNAAKILELQEQVADLTEQLAEKSAELEALNTKIAQGDVDLEDDANVILKEIERLEGEINEANEDAKLLQQAVDRAGDVPTSNTTEIDEAIAEAQNAISGQSETIGDELQSAPEVQKPAGYVDYKMLTNSPKYINTDLTSNVNDHGELYIQNKGGNAYTANVNGVDITITAGTKTIIGALSTLDKSALTIRDYEGDIISGGKFWLTND